MVWCLDMENTYIFWFGSDKGDIWRITNLRVHVTVTFGEEFQI
jgi:hypothetical protein